MEIERKWVCENAYEVARQCDEIMWIKGYEQVYISIDPEIRLSRSRMQGSEEAWRYKITFKSKSDLSRIEIEKDLTEDEFNGILKIAGISQDQFIQKLIYGCRYKSYLLTVGHATSNDLMVDMSYGEIEFDSEEEAEEFQAPDWFGRDVTYDETYKMASLWYRWQNTLSF